MKFDQDRDRQDTEIDVVARLLDGRIIAGAAKFRRRPADSTVLLEHLDAPEATRRQRTVMGARCAEA